MKRRILIVLEAGDAYPSGYVRGLIYRPFFEKAGWEARFVSRQWASLIRLLFNPPSALAPFFNRIITGFLYRLASAVAYCKELWIIQLAKSADVVYTSKVISQRLLQGIKRVSKARVVLDFGDALWLPGARIQALDTVLRLADAVTTDNDLTARYIQPINARCTVIPDSPQIEEFDQWRHLRKPNPDRVTLGWVGSPSTLYNLYAIWEPLEKLFAKHSQLHLRLVGMGSDKRLLPPFENVRYSMAPRYTRSEMIREVLAMDIGLFPLQDVQASLVRGILKATVYMAGEAVVVASALGQLPSLIQDDVNGYLASTSSEWQEKLERLIQDPERRRKMAQAGLETVRRDYTVDKSFAKLISALEVRS